MTTVPPYRFLDKDDEIGAFCERLRGEPVVAIDLEADGLHHYRDQICLVQVSTVAENAILDPLAGPGVLDGLAPVLGDPAVLKILHGGDYDVRLLKRERRTAVRGVFDTMIAAQLAGRERFGLAALLEEGFGVALDKRYQRADWSRRPLGPELLAYAAADTAYLPALRGRISAELSALGRLAWAEEEFRLLESIEPGAPRKPWCLDLKGAGRLAPRALARLQELLELREELARTADRPPFMILSNQVLLGWAQLPPSRRREVVGTPRAGRALLERSADLVLAALERAEALPEEQCPRAEPMRNVVLGPAEAARLKRLRAVREEAAHRLRLAPGLIVNGATLERLCRAGEGEGENNGIVLLKNWQREALGEPFRAALAGC